ncbi:MAG: hypothetical protein GC162_14640 [Planctomycetes bacterium]|nr:hypothetical protein [Planctomycetota bacterium]
MLQNTFNHWRLLVAASVLAPFLTTLPAEGAIVTVLEDNFNNGIVANSDSNVGYWSQNLNSGPGDANSIAESGGILSMTVGDNAGTNHSNFSGVVIYSGVTSDFNFFTHEITIAVRGISFTNNGTPTIGGAAERLRMMLLSDGINSNAANDAVVVSVDGAGKLTLGSKVNAPTSASDGATIHKTFTGSGVTGFDLTIGPGTGTNINYTITVLGGSSGTASGSFVFDVSNWNGAGGNAALGFWTQEATITGGNQYFTTTLDSVKVTTIVPTPAALPAGLGLLAAAALRRRRV